MVTYVVQSVARIVTPPTRVVKLVQYVRVRIIPPVLVTVVTRVTKAVVQTVTQTGMFIHPVVVYVVLEFVRISDTYERVW